MGSEAPSSPSSRLKFLCSYGGRILPRPSDGHLRYVGGEIRVLSVPRSISFKELKEKIAGMFNAELVKYQLITEDLDTLVTVKNDEDLDHMIDEYDRLERRPRSPTVVCSPRFRLFIFPYAAATAATEPSTPHNHQYVDAINGGVPITEHAQHQHARPLFAVSSARVSPSSTVDSLSVSTVPRGVGLRSDVTRRNMGCGGMHRVRSTPNLDGEGSQTGSPQAYQKSSVTFGYGGGSRWRLGGGGWFRQEVDYGCRCNCGCVGSSSQLTRKYVCSPPTPAGSPLGSSAEVSAPFRGSQHLGPPPNAGPWRRILWE